MQSRCVGCLWVWILVNWMDVAGLIPFYGRDMVRSASERLFQAYSCNPVMCFPPNPLFGPFQVDFVEAEDGKGLARPFQGSCSAPLHLLHVDQKVSQTHRALRLNVSFRNYPQQRSPYSFHQVFHTVSQTPEHPFLGFLDGWWNFP